MQIDSKKKYTEHMISLLRNYKSSALTAMILIIIGYIFFSSVTSDVIIFGILGTYIFILNFYQLSSKITFLICFFILAAFSVLFVFTNISDYTETAAVCLFIFMAVGIFQEIRSTK